MKHSAIILLMVIILPLTIVSCSKSNDTRFDSIVFEAWTPNNDAGTKIYFDSSRMVYWTENDQISVFRSATNEQYQFDGETGDDYGTFSKIDETVKSTSYTRNYAIYPYSNAASCSETGLVSFSFPAIQQYAEKSPGLGASAMVAATADSEDSKFRFRNLCGYLMLKITGDVTIREIELKGNDDEVLSGAATAQIIYLNTPVVSVNPSGSKTVTLNCAPGIVLSKTIPTEFWFAIPQTTFSAGFTLSFTTTSEGWYSKSTTKCISIERNSITPMSAFNISKTEIDNQLELPAMDGEIDW